MKREKIFLAVFISILLFLPSIVGAVPPMPYRIGGTVTVEGTALTSATDTGYTFKVTKEDGTTDYVSASGAKAEDTDGVSATGWYIIDVPMYSSDQTGGANEGDVAIIHAYKDGNELAITDPVDGEFTIPVGAAGTTKQINLLINVPPVANAGPDQTVDEDTVVTLDGSGSTDAQPIASYLWEQTAGATVSLSSTTVAKPTFTAPPVAPGMVLLTFKLTVTDTGELTHSDTVTINLNFVNDPPVASAGPDQTVDEGVTVTLDGSNSTDPDDGIDTFQWTQTAGTPAVTLSDATAQKPTFTAPDVGPNGTALTFQLTVTDKGGLTNTDTCIINVTWVNIPPTANAGADQTVNEGDAVTLSGSGTDPDDGIKSYQWTQTAGTPTATLSDSTAASPTFTAPDVGVGGAALTFQLTVTDNGGLQATDSCIVNISFINTAPTANAGIDQTAEEGTTVTLDGSGSDPDAGDSIASYLWTQTAGPSVTLSSAADAKPTFVPGSVTESTVFSFELTVTDKGGLKATDGVAITVNDNGITDYPDITDAMTFKSYNEENFAGKIASGGACVYLDPVDPSTITDDEDRPEELPYGLWDIAFKTDTVGGTVNVTIYLPEAADEEMSWYKYSPTDGWSDFSANAAFNANRTQVTLTLTDGGAGDDDGAADGMIIDPSGLGTAPEAIPLDKLFKGGDGGNCFIATAAYGSPMERHVKVLRDFRDRFLVTNPVGKAFVDIYYRYSPPVADFIADNEALKASIRYGLLPFVGASWVALHVGIVPIVIIAFLLIMGIVYGFTFRRVARPQN